MKTVKEWLLFMVVAVVSMVAVSCSDDDEPKVENTSFYVEISSIKGGGLSDNEIESLKTALNQRLKTEVLKGNEQIVVQKFMLIINNLRTELQSKYPSPADNLAVTVQLKDEGGNEVASQEIILSKPVIGK